MTVVREGLLVDSGALGPGDAVRLQASRCEACGAMEFPGREVCAWCGGASTLVGVGPEATLVGFTAVLYPTPGSIMEPPYDIGVARFGDGLHVLGLLVSSDGSTPRLGAPVESCAFEVPDGRLTYAFKVVR